MYNTWWKMAYMVIVILRQVPLTFTSMLEELSNRLCLLCNAVDYFKLRGISECVQE